MEKRILGQTGISISPIIFGGNVFGWTADKKISYALLDSFFAQGFDSIDTADMYSNWAPGNNGGESETIIGDWFKSRLIPRDQIKIFTKAGLDLGRPGEKGLSEKWLNESVNRSLKRLKTDYIDIFFSHTPDQETPLEETLGAYQKLIDAGKIRTIGVSNANLEHLKESINIAQQHNFQCYQVIQPEYNLYDRHFFENELQAFCLEKNLGVISYFSLASGFLSGKYLSKADLNNSARASMLEKYINPRGYKILEVVAKIADQHDTTLSEIALAWILAQTGITAPIISATSLKQLEHFKKALALKLSKEDLIELNEASK